MNASDLLIKCLENEGVEFIFGIPGEENLSILESIRTSKIKFILTRHEQAAGFMAATYGKLTGRAGVCLTTLGPGATNLITSIAYAQLGAMPMVVITGQKPIKHSTQGNFQILNIVRIFEPITKATQQISSASQIPSMIRNAFRLAEQERPGVAHLELPEDIALETVKSPVFFKKTPTYSPVPPPHSISKAISALKKSTRPLILVGAGSNRKNIKIALTKFISKTGINFFSTQMGKGAVGDDNVYYLGTAAITANDHIHKIITRADLIINIGHDVVEKPPFIMKTKGQTVIHVNFIPADVRNIYFPQIEIIGDIGSSLELLTKGLSSHHRFSAKWLYKTKALINKDIHSFDEDGSFPMTPQKIVSDVRESLDRSAIVSLDNGMFKLWFARNFEAPSSNTLLLDNALATMGAGLPAAIASCLIFPKKQILAVCGDGGFMMSSQEVETAIRLKINLVILILVDNGFGMIKWKQNMLSLPDFSLNFSNPDFKKYAESYGAKGHLISSPGQLKLAITRSFKEGGVHIIETPIDYSSEIEVSE